MLFNTANIGVDKILKKQSPCSSQEAGIVSLGKVHESVLLFLSEVLLQVCVE